MTLHVTVHHVVGRLTLNVSLETAASFIALVGPSGAGKTTLLNVIAGLVHPIRGVVRMNNETLVDTDHGRWLPPHERRIGYVFQDARLFPHLNVRHNLTYGQRDGHIRFDDVVEMLDLGALLGRRARGLSGGEQQRVAIGRALLSQPRLLLLDEPLASVDVTRKGEVLPYLDRLRSEIQLPTIYVTHATEEIAARAEITIQLVEGRQMDVEAN